MISKISVEDVYENFKKLYDELQLVKDVDIRDSLTKYVDYSLNQPMRDGEEIRYFLDTL